MLQWLKRSLASLLGDKKDIVKNLPLIKKLNEKANVELDSTRSRLLKENFGTLLGYYRERDFINHDLDMDFGIIIPNYADFLVVEKELLDKGFQRTKEFYFDKNLVELSYNYKGLNVDFILYKKDSNKISSDTIFYMTNALGNPTRYEVYHYELPFNGVEECNFKNTIVKIPGNVEEYLSNLYGEDFRVPNTNYNWKENPIYQKVKEDMAEVILKKNK